MFVHRPRLKTQGAVVTVAMLALGACDDPTARTDLRPEGPPDVLAVLVLNDAFGGLIESATFCKLNDDKRPGLVGLPDFTTTQVCPETLSEQAPQVNNAAPQGWYVRVMFDELLDPSVEDLIPVLDENKQETGVFTGTIARTKPITLQCQDVSGTMVDVAFDGYYSPSGNAVTWPLGPSLVIRPSDPTTISVNSECQITLKDNIADKDGIKVLQEQRGPYKFKLAPVEAILIAPADDEKVDPEFGGVEVVFNTNLNPASLCINGDAPFPIAGSACTTDDGVGTDSKFQMTTVATAENPNPPPLTFVGIQMIAATGATQGNDFFVFGDLLDNQTYTFEIPQGVELEDHCGVKSVMPAPSVEKNTKVTYKTGAIELFSVAPFAGTGAAPGRKIRIDFNQLMDFTTIDLGTDYTIDPAPVNAAFRQDFNGDLSVAVLNGIYALNTEYTFTLKKGAVIRDVYDTKDFVIENDIVAKFKTAEAIALTASSPASGATVSKAAANVPISIRLTFNQEMNPASFAAGTDFTLVDDATGAQVPVAVVNDPANGPAVIRFRSTTPAGGALAPGNYTFTFKAGAVVEDKVVPPNSYTQATDRVIKFTVAETSFPTCLGQTTP